MRISLELKSGDLCVGGIESVLECDGSAAAHCEGEKRAKVRDHNIWIKDALCVRSSIFVNTCGNAIRCSHVMRANFLDLVRHCGVRVRF